MFFVLADFCILTPDSCILTSDPCILTPDSCILTSDPFSRHFPAHVLLSHKLGFSIESALQPLAAQARTW